MDVRIQYFPDADALWFRFGVGEESYGKLVDDKRILHYNEDSEMFAVTFLYASEGIDTKDTPGDVEEYLAAYLRHNTLQPDRAGIHEKIPA